MKKRNIFTRAAIALAVIAIVMSAVSCISVKPPLLEKEGMSHEKLDLIDSLFKAYTLFELDDEALMDAVLKGYVEGTGDKYAEYFTAEEYEKLTSENRGETVGIGISVIQNAEKECIEIINVVPDSPALAAGLQPGDLITYVGIGEDRQAVSELGYTNALDLLVGEKGTTAEITVFRPEENGGKELEFSIVREKVTAVSVTCRVCETDPKVGVVRITGFDLTTPNQFSEAVDELVAKGCDRFVFDVRYNPGGDLLSIQAVLSYFLNENDVFIRTADRNKKTEELKIEAVTYSGDYSTCSVAEKDIGKYRDLKFAVLTNGSTASAAELFTSALKDYGLGTVVGETTYGKGTMQSTYSLTPYGYSGALKLTTRYYFPPVSESYDGIGIAPDVEVELDEALAGKNIYKITDAEDNQLRAAIEELYKK